MANPSLWGSFDHPGLLYIHELPIFLSTLAVPTPHRALIHLARWAEGYPLLCTHQWSRGLFYIQNQLPDVPSVMDSLHGLLHLRHKARNKHWLARCHPGKKGAWKSQAIYFPPEGAAVQSWRLILGCLVDIGV